MIIASIMEAKILLKIVGQNHYLDSLWILTISTPEIMSRVICCKKSFLINRDANTRVSRLMDFPEFAINHESQWELQLSISEVLGHHSWRWIRNLHFKFFLSIYLLKELTMLWRFYINVRDCVAITGYWSETIFIISLKKNIVFEKLFEVSFVSNMLASFTEFQC